MAVPPTSSVPWSCQPHPSCAQPDRAPPPFRERATGPPQPPFRSRIDRQAAARVPTLELRIILDVRPRFATAPLAAADRRLRGGGRHRLASARRARARGVRAGLYRDVVAQRWSQDGNATDDRRLVRVRALARDRSHHRSVASGAARRRERGRALLARVRFPPRQSEMAGGRVSRRLLT
jgi:hypothetical protein